MTSNCSFIIPNLMEDFYMTNKKYKGIYKLSFYTDKGLFNMNSEETISYSDKALTICNV